MNQRMLDSLPVEQETTIREMFQNHPKRRLRERALMIILSSNKSFADWGEVLGDSVIASAVLDRLLHHSTVFNIRGDSYRLREKKKELIGGEEKKLN